MSHQGPFLWIVILKNIERRPNDPRMDKHSQMVPWDDLAKEASQLATSAGLAVPGVCDENGTVGSLSAFEVGGGSTGAKNPDGVGPCAQTWHRCKRDHNESTGMQAFRV